MNEEIKEDKPTTEQRLESLKTDEKKCVAAIADLTQKLEILKNTRMKLIGAIEVLTEVTKDGS